MHKRVIKFINSRTPKEKQKIKEKLQQLQNNPYPSDTLLDVKKLQNFSGFRLRVNDYRFLYDIAEEEITIYIEKGDNRGDIY